MIIEKKRNGTYKINVKCIVHAFEHRELIPFQLQCTTQMVQTCFYLFSLSKQLQVSVYHYAQHQHHIIFFCNIRRGRSFWIHGRH